MINKTAEANALFMPVIFARISMIVNPLLEAEIHDFGNLLYVGMAARMST
jgi:hypothetical protein